MSNHLPSIGAITTSTNSLSRGYLAYLACIDSWTKWVDHLVIVDGGTSDRSFDVLKQWCLRTNWEIYSSPTCFWGPRAKWHASQWTISTTEGFRMLETDWAFILNSDYVLDVQTVKGVREMLARNDDALYVTFKRLKLNNNGDIYSVYPGVAINLKRMRRENINIAFGVNLRTKQLSDAPIVVQERTRFSDPVNGAIKTVFKGELLRPQMQIDLASIVYGHYFFTYDQVIDKLMDFCGIYNVRYSKRAPKSAKHFAFEHALSKAGTILPKEKELQKPHPQEIKRVIDSYYQPEFVGHGNRPPKACLYSVLRAYQKVRTVFFQLRGFPGVQENELWSDLKEQPSSPLNLAEIYKRQDLFLSHEYTG